MILSHNGSVIKSNTGQKEQETLENGAASSTEYADMTTLVADTQSSPAAQLANRFGIILRSQLLEAAMASLRMS